MGLHIYMYMHVTMCTCVYCTCIYGVVDIMILLCYLSVGALNRIEWTQDGQLLTSSLKNGKHSESYMYIVVQYIIYMYMYYYYM